MVVAGLTILYTLGINVTPILTGLGIAGLAVSLGAQTLIRDIIGGLIVLMENQYRIGDTITVGTVTGDVEQITLRATYLRDMEGRRITVPNGDVRLITNTTRAWARVVVDLTVGFDSDTQSVLWILEQAMQMAGSDDTLKPLLLEPPQVIGWNTFTDSGVQMRLQATTKADDRLQVAQGLRRYAMEALLAAKIPFKR